MWKTVALSLLIVVCAASSFFWNEKSVPSVYADCDLTTSCEGKEPGNRTIDPADCHNYYVCVDIGGELQPSAAPISCDEGLYFDPEALDGFGDCVNETVPCTSPCRSNCSLQCFETYDVIAYPGNCSRYYICILGGETVMAECPVDKPYFDGGNCTTNAALCCDFCTSNCPEIGVQVADPCNCKHFYICEEVGTPTNDTLVSCPSGEHFDIYAETCVGGDACEPICDCNANKFELETLH